MINDIPKAYLEKGGVYSISSTINAKVYIGSTNCFRLRYNQHLSGLKSGKHTSKHLQHHYSKYGFDSLEFKVLDVCEDSDLLNTEQYFIDAIDPFGERGFNTNKTAGTTRGYKHTEESKRIMSQKKLGVKRSKEVSENMRRVWTGKKHTPEAIANMRKAKLGGKHTVEARRNMSLAHIGNKHTPEQTEKIRQCHLGKGHLKNMALVLNQETGIFYGNIKAAANSTSHISHCSLHRKVTGKFVNNTPFIRV